MNRLAALPDEPLTAATNTPENLFDCLHRPHVVAPTADESDDLATFLPMHYEVGYAYPLLVWLHGRGGSQRQLRQVMPLISMRNHVAIAPRGTMSLHSADDAYGWSQSDDHIEQAERRVFDGIARAEARFHIDRRRIFLAGYGSGGTMAMRIAWKYPDRFAGAATLGGPVPRGRCPLARINILRRLPLLVATGRAARGYHEAQVCRDLRLLHSAGCTVALRQYPAGDELRTTMLADLDRWIMEIVCAQGAPVRA